MLFGLARCGLPFNVVECCSVLIRYVVNHLLYFVSVKLKFFIVGRFARGSKFVSHAGFARIGGRNSAGNDDTESFSKALSNFLGSAGC